MSAITDQPIPGYVAGGLTIDPVYSQTGFSIRHLMVSMARGKLTTVSAVRGENEPVCAPRAVEFVGGPHLQVVCTAHKQARRRSPRGDERRMVH